LGYDASNGCLLVLSSTGFGLVAKCNPFGVAYAGPQGGLAEDWFLKQEVVSRFVPNPRTVRIYLAP
jgi:hypothetical protein